LFSARAELAHTRAENKKTLQTPKADEGILTWAVIQEDHKIILPPLQRKRLDARHQGFIVFSLPVAGFIIR
jgi:hypothetical protein